jgi:hypothetical protein
MDELEEIFGITESPKKPKITGKILPLWAAGTTEVLFLSRTDTAYAKVKVGSLHERGIQNGLFTALIATMPKGVYIAGGFMTSLLQEDKHAKDIDLFCNSEQAFKDICNMLIEPPEKKDSDDGDVYWPFRGYKTETDIVKFNEHNESVRFLKFTHEGNRPEIQIMKMSWYDSPEHVIDTFDLTIAQIATDGEFVYLNPLTQFDLAKKRLVLHRMQFPASTIRRIVKYAAKGYYACPGSLVNISSEIQQWTQKMDIDEANFVYLD